MLFEHKNLVRLSLQSLGFGRESWVEGKMSRAEGKMSRVHKKEKNENCEKIKCRGSID